MFLLDIILDIHMASWYGVYTIQNVSLSNINAAAVNAFYFTVGLFGKRKKKCQDSFLSRFYLQTSVWQTFNALFI